MPKKTDPELIEPAANYHVVLARPIRLAGIAMHPGDPEIIVSGAILETILSAVASFVKVEDHATL